MAIGPKRTLQQNIATLLGNITGIHEVSRQPKLDFAGWPAAFIVPSGNDAEYLSNTENKRMYKYNIWLLNEVDQPESLQAAWDDLMDLSDEIIDTIDAQDSPESARAIADDIPAAHMLAAVYAVPAEDIADLGEKLVGCRISVTCFVVTDIDQL